MVSSDKPPLDQTKAPLRQGARLRLVVGDQKGREQTHRQKEDVVFIQKTKSKTDRQAQEYEETNIGMSVVSKSVENVFVLRIKFVDRFPS